MQLKVTKKTRSLWRGFELQLGRNERLLSERVGVRELFVANRPARYFFLTRNETFDGASAVAQKSEKFRERIGGFSRQTEQI